MSVLRFISNYYIDYYVNKEVNVILTLVIENLLRPKPHVQQQDVKVCFPHYPGC